MSRNPVSFPVSFSSQLVLAAGAVLSLIVVACFSGCGQATAMQKIAQQAQSATPQQEEGKSGTKQASTTQLSGMKKTSNLKVRKLESITLGAGCFWCTEAVFQRLEGVEKVTSGYCNGEWPDPTYDDICTGRSGHAEVCKVEYDPAKIALPELLEVFWKTHDPTTLNRQGGDSGTQYRSGIYFTTKEQQAIALELKEKLNKSGAWGSDIVTEIVPAEKFYPAEDYHQDYFNGVAAAAQEGKRKGNFGYCARIIVPKLEKFEAIFADKLKSTAFAKREAEAAKATGSTAKNETVKEDGASAEKEMAEVKNKPMEEKKTEDTGASSDK